MACLTARSPGALANVEKFSVITAIAAPLMRVNIDTDIIIPSREMKRVSKKGLSNGLFAGWRYTDIDERVANPEFVLNHAAYLGTQIIIAGENFGCGSSREHAVWALVEYGIRAVIAPSFSAIFHSNCIQNGVLPVTLPADEVAALAKLAVGGSSGIFTIDLLAQHIIDPAGRTHTFEISPNHRQTLLDGLDPIDRTLTLKASIEDFEQNHYDGNTWAKLSENQP